MVPDDAVITDRTAGWLHGAPMILAPNDHLRVPPVSIFRSPGYRLRNSATASGERTLGVGDVVEIDGLRVTSKLRTTCDLGRLLHRDQAMAAMDSMMHVADFGPDVSSPKPNGSGASGVCASSASWHPWRTLGPGHPVRASSSCAGATARRCTARTTREQATGRCNHA